MSWTIIGKGGNGGVSPAGGIPNPNAGVLADGEMLRSNAAGTAMVGTGDINTDTNVDFGIKTVKFGTNSTQYGEMIKQGVGGESIVFTQLIDNKFFRLPVVPDSGVTSSFSAPVGTLQTVTQEAIKADVLIDPTWQASPPVPWRVQTLRFEAAVTQTNCFFTVSRAGIVVNLVRLGTLTGGVEKLTDLTDPSTGNVPYEIDTGATYDLAIFSSDGPLSMNGSNVSGQPFGVVQYFKFEERDQLDDHSALFGRVENKTEMRSDGPVEYIQGTGVLSLLPYQDIVTQNDPITALIQPVVATTETFITGIELAYLAAQTGVKITVETLDGTAEFLTDVSSGVTIVKLPNPLRLQSLENYQFTVDNTLTAGGSSVMGGTDPGAGFEIYFQVEVEASKVRDLDPDQRIQNRTIQMPLTLVGYESQSGGGVIETQGWTDQSTGAALLTPEPDVVADGRQSLKSSDNDAGGLTQMVRAVDDTDIPGALQRLFDNGGWLGFELRAEAESSNVSASAGVGFSALNDPGWKAGARGRWLFQSSLTAADNQAITPEGGTEIDTGIPKHAYVYVGVKVSPGTMVGDIYINGKLTVSAYDFSAAVSNINYDDTIVYGSGSTSAVGRINWLRRVDIVIFSSGPQLPFSKRLMEDNTQGILPLNVYRDWELVVLDVDTERKSTGRLYLPNWGTLTLSRSGPGVTFNGQSEMVLQGPGAIDVSQVNIDDDALDRKYQITLSGGASILRSTSDYSSDRGVGYGGIQSTTPTAMSDIDATPQILAATDGAVSFPKNVIQNPATDAIVSLLEGVWTTSITFDISFDSAVGGRLMQAEIFNITDNSTVLLATLAVGRDQAAINIGATILLEIDDITVNDELAIRVFSTTDTFTTVSLTGYSFDLTLVDAI